MSDAAGEVEDIAIDSDPDAGRGSLVRATRDRAPVAVILSGPGRSATAAPKARELARMLADRGVSAIEVSGGAGRDASLAEHAAAAGAWALSARARTGARAVWLIGHGDGALIALSAARRRAGFSGGRDMAAGLILLAAPGRPLGVLMMERLRARGLSRAMLARAERVIDRLSHGETVERADIPDALGPAFHPEAHRFLGSVAAVDPLSLVPSGQAPSLIIQGDADDHVSVRDARRLHRALGGAIHIAPGVTHSLALAGARARARRDMRESGAASLAPGLADRIASFILDRRRAAPCAA